MQQLALARGAAHELGDCVEHPQPRLLAVGRRRPGASGGRPSPVSRRTSSSTRAGRPDAAATSGRSAVAPRAVGARLLAGAAADHGGAARAGLCGGLVDEPRLADPRLAADRHDLRAARTRPPRARGARRRARPRARRADRGRGPPRRRGRSARRPGGRAHRARRPRQPDDRPGAWRAATAPARRARAGRPARAATAAPARRGGAGRAARRRRCPRNGGRPHSSSQSVAPSAYRSRLGQRRLGRALLGRLVVGRAGRGARALPGRRRRRRCRSRRARRCRRRRARRCRA